MKELKEKINKDVEKSFYEYTQNVDNLIKKLNEDIKNEQEKCLEKLKKLNLN